MHLLRRTTLGCLFHPRGLFSLSPPSLFSRLLFFRQSLPLFLTLTLAHTHPNHRRLFALEAVPRFQVAAVARRGPRNYSVLSTVARAIQLLADGSNVPVISQAASSVMKLLSMLEKRRETSAKAASLYNRCGKLAHMLKEADILLQQVGSRLASIFPASFAQTRQK